METKECSICHKQLPLNMFYKRGNGLRKDCKECVKNRVNNYRINNLEEVNEKQRERYYKDRENRKAKVKLYKSKHKSKISNYTRDKQHNYCIDNTKIENYQKALADNFINWERHHRLETHTSDGIKRIIPLSKEELKALEVYYNRPPEELIYLTVKEHRILHYGK